MKTKIKIMVSLAAMAAMTLCSCTDDSMDNIESSDLPAAGTLVQFSLSDVSQFAETRTVYNNRSPWQDPYHPNNTHLIWVKGDSIYMTCTESIDNAVKSVQAAHYVVTSDAGAKQDFDYQDKTYYKELGGTLASIAQEGYEGSIRWKGDNSTYKFSTFYAPNGISNVKKTCDTSTNTVTFTMPATQDSTTMDNYELNALKNRKSNVKMHAKYCVLWGNTIKTGAYDGKSSTIVKETKKTSDDIHPQVTPIVAVAKFILTNRTESTLYDVSLSLKHTTANLSGTFSLDMNTGALTDNNGTTTGLGVTSAAAKSIPVDSSQVYMLCLPIVDAFTNGISAKDMTLTMTYKETADAETSPSVKMNSIKTNEHDGTDDTDYLTFKRNNMTGITITKNSNDIIVTSSTDNSSITIEKGTEISGTAQ